MKESDLCIRYLSQIFVNPYLMFQAVLCLLSSEGKMDFQTASVSRMHDIDVLSLKTKAHGRSQPEVPTDIISICWSRA